MDNRNKGIRFIRLKDVVINPAYIQSIIVVEKRNPNQIAEPEVKTSSNERYEEANKYVHNKINELRKED